MEQPFSPGKHGKSVLAFSQHGETDAITDDDAESTNWSRLVCKLNNVHSVCRFLDFHCYIETQLCDVQHIVHTVREKKGANSLICIYLSKQIIF